MMSPVATINSHLKTLEAMKSMVTSKEIAAQELQARLDEASEHAILLQEDINSLVDGATVHVEVEREVVSHRIHAGRAVPVKVNRETDVYTW